MGLKEIYMPTVILITLLVFIKARRKFGFNFFLIFSFYLLINLFVELSSNIVAYYDLNNITIYNIAILIEGVTFCYLFYYVNNNLTIRRFLTPMVILFILFWAVNFFFLQKSKTLNTYTYLLS